MKKSTKRVFFLPRKVDPNLLMISVRSWRRLMGSIHGAFRCLLQFKPINREGVHCTLYPFNSIPPLMFLRGGASIEGVASVRLSVIRCIFMDVWRKETSVRWRGRRRRCGLHPLALCQPSLLLPPHLPFLHVCILLKALPLTLLSSRSFLSSLSRCLSLSLSLSGLHIPSSISHVPPLLPYLSLNPHLQAASVTLSPPSVALTLAG